MRELRSYIVRIYRRGARDLAGILEDPHAGTQRPFRTMDELWSLLREASSRRNRRSVHPGSGRDG